MRGNFAQMAHIWAFSEGGPRSSGAKSKKPKQIHALDNLMLLCSSCHKLVDDNPTQFSVETLKKFKKAHEDRVFTLTDTKPDRHTTSLAMFAQIGAQEPRISLAEIQTAVAPSYVGARDNVVVDLTGIGPQNGPEYFKVAKEAIRAKVARLYETPADDGLPRRHISVFALAPIPLLVYLGTCLMNTIPTELYQRHRDTEDWNWKEEGGEAEYEISLLRKGDEKVSLLVNLSGQNDLGSLPSEFASSTVYEISLTKPAHSPGFLRTKSDLRLFRQVYQSALRKITGDNPQVKELNLFPAVPAPVAITIGRDLLPKRDPALNIYDYDRKQGGFAYTFQVNTS